jgi:hypothetical protein
MSDSKSKLKVRTLDEMFKKISESSENDPEQLAHTSENSPALSLSETDFHLKTKVFVLLCHPLGLIWQCQGMEVQYSVEYRWLKRKAPSPIL